MKRILYLFSIVFFGYNFGTLSLFDLPDYDNQNIDQTASDVDQKFKREEVTFYALKAPGSKERMPRKGLLSYRKDAPATILILHGFGLDKFTVAPFRLLVNKYNVMTFDFRAHGEFIAEQESTIGLDEVLDVFAAVDYLKSLPDIKDKPIIAFGLSMGSSAAIEAQAQRPDLFDAMFLDTPFSNSEAFVGTIAEKLKFSVSGYDVNFLSNLVKKYAFTDMGQELIKLYLKFIKGENLKVNISAKPIAPIESIKKITIPIALVVCKNDELIPYKEVVKMVDAHPGITRMVITGGTQHCHSVFFVPEYYKVFLNTFIKDVVTGKIYNQEPKKEIKEVMTDARVIDDFDSEKIEEIENDTL